MNSGEQNNDLWEGLTSIYEPTFTKNQLDGAISSVGFWLNKERISVDSGEIMSLMVLYLLQLYPPTPKGEPKRKIGHQALKGAMTKAQSKVRNEARRQRRQMGLFAVPEFRSSPTTDHAKVAARLHSLETLLLKHFDRDDLAFFDAITTQPSKTDRLLAEELGMGWDAFRKRKSRLIDRLKALSERLTSEIDEPFK